MRTRILVVEDDAVVALHLRTLLERSGYAVIGVCDAAEKAVALVRQHLPSLVLMDITLKGAVDGIDAARELSQRFSTPVVFVTGSFDDTMLTRATAAAPFGYLLKPINERELIGVIELALGRHRQELATRRLERWLLATLRSMVDAVVLVDEGGHVAYMNPAAEVLTGWSLAEAVGREHVVVVERRDLPATASRARRRAAHPRRQTTRRRGAAHEKRRHRTRRGFSCPCAR